MVFRRVNFLNARQLACALWLLHSIGEPPTRLGTMIGAPVRHSAGDPSTADEIRSWATEHAFDWPADFATIEYSTPGLSTRPAMRQLVVDLGPQLSEWLDTVWPNRAATEPDALDRMWWMIRHRRLLRYPLETFLLLPTEDHVVLRLAEATHVLSRSFIRDEPAFQAWARHRRRSDIQPLGSALRAAS